MLLSLIKVTLIRLNPGRDPYDRILAPCRAVCTFAAYKNKHNVNNNQVN
jgi:hypothetical protein